MLQSRSESGIVNFNELGMRNFKKGELLLLSLLLKGSSTSTNHSRKKQTSDIDDGQRPITNAQLPTTNYQLPTTNCQRPTTNYPRPTANAQLPTPNAQRPTPNAQRPTTNENEKSKRFEKNFRISLVVGRWLKRTVGEIYSIAAALYCTNFHFQHYDV